MDDQPNNDLKNRINEVFDQFEAPQEAADTGWIKLRKRLSHTQKRRPAIWWLSAAAVLLFGTLFFITLYKPAPIAVNKQKATPESSIDSSQHQQEAPNATSSAHQLAAQNPPIMGAAPQSAINTKPGGVNAHSVSRVNQFAKIPVEAADTSNRQLAMATANPTANTSSMGNDSLTEGPTASAIASVAATPTARPPVQQRSASATMEDVFAMEAKRNQPMPESAEDKKSPGNPLSLSVYAGTYVNYAKGSNNQLNAGGGVTSDVRISRRLKLVTGIAITQNSLSYNQNNIQPSMNSAALAAIGKPSSVISVTHAETFGAYYSVPVTQVSNYSATLTGLEIPVNIKYELSSEQTDTYLMAGVSSGTFINENYNYSYINNLVTVTNQNAGSQAHFSSFDLAHTLNVALGIGTPVGKSNRLIIEPFVKYPLGGLGSQQIRFGAGGVNLKFNILSHK